MVEIAPNSIDRFTIPVVLVVALILGWIGAVTLRHHEASLPTSIGSTTFAQGSSVVAARIKQQCPPNAADQAKCEADVRADAFAERIFNDAAWFHELWVRWLITDWALTFFAAGSAVIAAIRNAYSSKTDSQPKLAGIDLLVAFLAVGAVFAATFQSKLHASELADRYRYGDLILQDAKAAYEEALTNGISKTDATQALYASWKDAQKRLEGTFPKDTENKPEAPKTESKDKKKTTISESSGTHSTIESPPA